MKSRVLPWILGLLVATICGLAALYIAGALIVKFGLPDKYLSLIWATLFSAFMFGCQGLITYDMHRKKKNKEIRDGQRPINP
jgi:hypothetical protein